MSDTPPRSWTILRSSYVYRSPWLTARKDQVRLGSGLELEDYYVLEYPDWVNAVLLTPARELVLVRIYRHGIGEVHLEVPGGCVDPGEEPLAAARREALEETGYEAEAWLPLGRVCANPATHNNRTHLFLGLEARKTREPELEASEELTTVLTPLSEIGRIMEEEGVVQASHALALTRVAHRFGVC